MPEQFEEVLGGGNQVPLAIHLLQAPQQEPPQTPAFLDLPFHRFYDHFALGVELGSFLGSELAVHAGADRWRYKRHLPDPRRR